jgi:low temperature requirement protein LtrA
MSSHYAATHGRRRFSGRDPSESHRASTPLELLYDLTIVVAFGTAADELAHYVADDHIAVGVAGFVFASFAVSWAWLGYSWFASAYDTDDWVFRLATMVQMAGVIVLSLGLPQMFSSLDEGAVIDTRVMVGGYVIMRVALLFLWWQVSLHDPERRRTARSYIFSIGTAQIGWVVCAVLDLTLGEAIIGTVASLNALVHGEAGWTVDAALLTVAGVGLTFGCWWMYFAVPWAEPLVRHRPLGFIFGYGHLFIFGALAAIGGGLHVAAFNLEGEAEIGTTAVVLSVAIPFAAYALVFYGIYSTLMHELDPFHVGLLVATGAVLAVAALLAAAGVGMAVCLLVVMLAPWVTVIGFETLGHRHIAAALERL